MRVHSLSESAPQPESFLAYIAVPAEAEEREGRWGESDLGPSFEVEVIKSATGLRRTPLSTHLLMSSVTEVRDAPEGAVELVLSGPGVKDTVLRAEAGTEEYFAGEAVVLEPQLLGTIGAGIRLHPVKVEFAPDPAQDPWDSDVWLPVARVHRPARRGCSSVYTTTDRQSVTHSANFSVGGMGGGGYTNFTVEFTREYPAKAKCKEARVLAELEVRFGTTLIDGNAVAYGTRVTVRNVRPEERGYADIPPEVDFCGWPPEKMPRAGRVSWDLHEATGAEGDTPGDTMKIGREAAGTLSVGVTFGRVPVTLSMAYTRACAKDSMVETRFAPGAKYLGYTPHSGSALERCWTIAAA